MRFKRIQFDGIILHYCFLGHRLRARVHTFMELYSLRRESSATKIAICQDDYTCNESSRHVGSMTWRRYRLQPDHARSGRPLSQAVGKPGVEFREGLTGYVDDDMLAG